MALVIFVHDRTGSFAAAGRLVDRRGPRLVLIPAAGLPTLWLPLILLRRELLHRAVTPERTEVLARGEAESQDPISPRRRRRRSRPAPAG